MKFKNKVAIITGAASGIGKVVAEKFSQEGAKVIIADLANSAGEEVASSIKKAGGNATFIACDVTSREHLQNLATKTYEEFGSIDIMYNNAGLGMKLTPIEEVDEDIYDKLMAVNMKGVFLGTQAVVPYMKKAGKGVILSTGSTAAIRPRSELSLYSATKGAVTAFSKSMALELAPFGIRVNCIHPVITNTPLAESKQIEEYSKSIPIGRIAQPIDIAQTAIFLASEEASMITGVGLEVDGGRCV